MSSALYGYARGGCGAREAHPAHFKSWGACSAAANCSRECQAADWLMSKAACKTACKAAAAVDVACSSSA
jgi:hypothetical protein